VTLDYAHDLLPLGVTGSAGLCQFGSVRAM